MNGMLKKFILLMLQQRLSQALRNPYQLNPILALFVASYLTDLPNLSGTKLCTRRNQKYFSSANIVKNLSKNRTCSIGMRSGTPGLNYTLVQTVKKYFTSLQNWRGTGKLILRNQRHLISVLSAARHLVNSTNLCGMNMCTLGRGPSPAPSVAKASLSPANAKIMKGCMRKSQKNVTNVKSVIGLL